MKRRKGVSLLNVMIFLLFSGMVTAQVFFFTATSIESVSEEREIMQYRMRLDELVEIAKDALRNTENEITHSDIGTLTYDRFYDNTQAKYSNDTEWKIPDKWTDKFGNTYDVKIHDLDYTFSAKDFDRNTWINDQYSGVNMYKKVFAAMSPLQEPTGGKDEEGNPIQRATHRYYLIRARAKLPDKFNGQNIMFQVLVKRDEKSSPHKVETLSFQEIWYGSDNK